MRTAPGFAAASTSSSLEASGEDFAGKVGFRRDPIHENSVCPGGITWRTPGSELAQE
jgi:hypothetical protein